MTNNHSNYDLLILGGGPAGYIAAIRAGQAGAKTAIIEKDKIGGTCLHKGCIPTKVLLHSAHVYSLCKNANNYGVNVNDITIDYERILKRKEQVVDRLYRGVYGLLKKNKIDIIDGEGRLCDGKKIVVFKNGKDILELTASHIILAAGSAPFMPEGIIIDGKYIISSDEIMDIRSIPDSIIIAGGGAIGVEFASLYNAIGSKVTILESKEHIMPMEDIGISAYMEKALKNQGIDILTSASLDCASTSEQGVEIKYIIKEEKRETKRADMLLAALGRTPVTKGIGIIETGIEMNGKFVAVDEKQETCCSGIYAIGDLTGPLLLAHSAGAQALAVVDHITGREYMPINYRNIPRVTYSFPQAASIGMTQKEAEQEGYKTRIGKFPFRANGKAAILGEDTGFIRVLSSEKDNRILGIQLIGPDVSELIGELSIALTMKIPAYKLSAAVHPHPTLSEAIQEAFHAVEGRAIHI